MLYSKIFWKVQSGFPVGKNAFYLTLWNMNYHQDGKDGGNQGGKIGGEQGDDLENRKMTIPFKKEG